MATQEKFSLLRGILQTLGLSKEAVDDVVDRISDWLSEKDDGKTTSKIKYPYLVREDFLSPAELSFYLVIKAAVSEWALICPKVSLGDLFFARSYDQSKFRIYTNKIDRKHVDFLLCDPKTVRPILGIELDDKSHQRAGRQERDEFVEKVFEAANLPLVRVPVRHTYSVTDLNTFFQKCARKNIAADVIPAVVQEENAAPRCPKCRNEMVLRSAKSGTNQGEKFWGCPKYPKCRGIVKFAG